MEVSRKPHSQCWTEISDDTNKTQTAQFGAGRKEIWNEKRVTAKGTHQKSFKIV